MAQNMNRDEKLKALVNAPRNAYNHGLQTATGEKPGGNAAPDGKPAGNAVSSGKRQRPSQSAHGRAQQRPDAKIGMFTVVKDNIVGILSVLGVTAIVVLMVFFLRGCGFLQTGGDRSAEAGGQSTQADSGAIESPYDWTKLDRTDGRYSYVAEDGAASKFGIDVSDNQHEVDWEAVAGDGVEFAMIRLGYRGATEGDLYVDEQYYANMAGAQAAGIKRGVYFFSQAISVEEAREEGNFVLSNLGGARLEYPVAFDSEVIPSLGETRTANLSNEEMTAIADAFCEEVEAGGYDTIVYGNHSDLTRYDIENLGGRGIWWAEYGQPTPLTTAAIDIWQYASEGSIAGIDTAVDLNIDLPPTYE